MTLAFRADALAAPSAPLGAAAAAAGSSDVKALAVDLLPASIEATSGRVLTRGVAAIRTSGMGWTARVSHMDRPGVIASMFFSERARDVVLRLEDGRRVQARIAGTSFVAASERVCDLVGTERLA